MRIAMAVPEPWRPRWFPDDVWMSLSGTGELVMAADPHSPEGFAELVATADAVVTSWGFPVLSDAVLDGAPRLRLVAHTGSSVKGYLTDAVWRRGVQVTQAGQAMVRPVAESALAMTLALLYRLPRVDHALRRGQPWDVPVPPRHELRGCPVGVVGASRIGRAYIELVRLLGAEVTVYDPYLGAGEAAALGVRVTGLDELMRRSRIVSIHAPTLPETRHLIGRRELALLRPGAGLVNTARSWLVDTSALLDELRSGRIDAALDVFDVEPLPVDDPLRTLPNVLLSPHEAAATAEARRVAGEIVVSELRRFAAGEPLEHGITPDMLDRMA